MSAPTSTTHHLCISVRGLLNWNRREFKRATHWITKDDGSRYTPDELRNALMDELAQGHEVLPYGDPCDGFDYKTGCPGHPAAARATPAGGTDK